MEREPLWRSTRSSITVIDGVSFFEAGNVVRWPKVIGGRRDRGRLRSRARLTRLTSRRGFGNFHEFSGFHVVDIAVYRNVIGNQRVVSDAHDNLDETFGIVREG